MAGIADCCLPCCASRRWPTLAAAQGDRFPSRPITLVVSYPAGGLSDLPARALAPELQARLGVPVVIENRVGGSGMVAGAHVARSEPNGVHAAGDVVGERHQSAGRDRCPTTWSRTSRRSG